MKSFEENLDIKILERNEEDLKFDISGVDAAMANALRRVMISEVPTMAIEKVNMWQNTSVIPDEVLAHRMGLIPIKADPRLFEYKEAKGEYTNANSIKFKLHVKCTRKLGAPPADPTVEILPKDEDKLFNHHTVFASDMV